MDGEHSAGEIDGDETKVGESSRCLPAAIAATTQQSDRHLWVEVADVKENVAEGYVDRSGQCACGDFFFFPNVDQHRACIDGFAPTQNV